MLYFALTACPVLSQSLSQWFPAPHSSRLAASRTHCSTMKCTFPAHAVCVWSFFIAFDKCLNKRQKKVKFVLQLFCWSADTCKNPQYIFVMLVFNHVFLFYYNCDLSIKPPAIFAHCIICMLSATVINNRISWPQIQICAIASYFQFAVMLLCYNTLINRETVKFNPKVHCATIKVLKVGNTNPHIMLCISLIP